MKNCPTHGGTETILLVEDEDMVSDLTKRILERCGYTVITATNGKEALNIYRKERDRISLVVLDLIMPEMGGEQCLEEFHKIDPNLSILVTSGYPLNDAAKESIESTARGFVGKPYNMKEILGAIRDILDSN